MIINKYHFNYVCDLDPDRTGKEIDQHSPQSRYANRRNISLNRYGEGSFCRFRIPNCYARSGVYVVTVNEQTMYVGECKNLTARFNTGYGQISPRNCFVGGQETNCRINKLILSEAVQGHGVRLWFMQTAAYKTIEMELRSIRRLPWNRV